MAESLKARLQAGETVWGTFIFDCPVPAMPRILKAAGWDYALIDTEHASSSIETVAALLHVAAGAGLPAVVRVPEPSRSLLCRALDAGAAGVMVPRVESRAQVEQVVRWTTYAPGGDRSVLFGAALTGYRAVDGAAFAAAANRERLLVIQVETRRGIEHVEEIVSTPGVDVAYIGPYDLSASLGLPGQVTHPRVLEAVDAFLAACRRHGVICGNYVESLEAARVWMARGFRFLTYATDLGLILQKSQDVLKELRKNV
ncbi:MAG: HpcH/HpaI aldolase/citrate lyase family protein [Candidatus Methylomirabilales bacterium]